MTFSNKISLLFLVFLLSIGTLLSVFLYNAATNATELEIKSNLQARAAYGIDKIDRLLFERSADVKAMANDPYIISNMNKKNVDLLTLRLLHYQNTYQFYPIISIYDQNRIKIADTSNLNLGQTAPDLIWNTRIYEQKKTSVAKDIYITNHASMMIFATPILDYKNNLLGAVVAEMNTNMIYEALGKLNFKNHTTEKINISIDLIDIDGLVLYSNHDPESVLKKTINLNNLDHLSEHFYTYAHQEGYLDFKGNNWTLITHLPINKAFTSITKLRNQAITVGSVLLVIATISIIGFSRQLITPILSLEKCAEKLGQGDFSVRAPILSNDEIGHLSRTFNHMARLLEQQVSQMQEFKKIFDISADMIFVLEANSQNFIYVNQAAATRSGYDIKSLLLHMNPYDLLLTEKYSETKRLFDALIHSENRVHLYETTILSKDGSTFPVEMLIQYVQLNAYESHYIAIARDITERKQAEHALQTAKNKAERANQTKTVFLSNMSHELRTPLNGILGYTQILKLDNNLSKHQQDGIDIIHRSGEYLLTMINDILDLSKIETEHLELYSSEFFLVKLLHNIVDLFRLRVQQKGIQFVFNLSQDLPQVVIADETRLRQALVNVLNNSLKSTIQGEISLSIYRVENKIRFIIEDTGAGISQQNIEQVLNPFKQFDARGFEVEGAGLGLTITNKIVKLMQGEFKIESKLGQGSRFSIDLALEEIDTSQDVDYQFDSAKTITGYEGSCLNIFVVDDEWETRQTLVEILSALAFKVCAFSHYQEILPQLRNIEPDLLIIDQSLLTEDFKTKQPFLVDIPLIVTAEDMYKHSNNLLDYNGLITKPIHIEELLIQLQKILKINWQYSEQDTATTDEVIAEHTTDTMQNCPLTPEQANILYDLGKKGDIMGLISEAEKLKKNTCLTSLAEQIIQFSENFDTDAVCEFVEPFIE